MTAPGASAGEPPLVVVALGGNALQRRGQPLDAKTMGANVRAAAERLAELAHDYRLVVAHGNGPQVGLLALQNEAYREVPPYPLDVLGAQTEGMIGYLLEQELDNRLPPGRTVSTLLTRVEVDAHDPAFAHPTKPIGPVYGAARMRQLADANGWTFVPDGDGYRRAVASPRPQRFVNLRTIRTLLEHGGVVVCAGGGGIPVVRTGEGDRQQGIEAVVDKDLAASLLARQLGADLLVIATDVDAVYLDWGLPTQRAIRQVEPGALRALPFQAGSMAPKVEAACEFVEQTGRVAVIGALGEIGRLVSGGAGTRVTT